MAASDPSSKLHRNHLNLDQLSGLAGRSFASTAEALDAVLRFVALETGMRSAFLARISRDTQEFEVLSAHIEPGGIAMGKDGASPLNHQF